MILVWWWLEYSLLADSNDKSTNWIRMLSKRRQLSWKRQWQWQYLISSSGWGGLLWKELCINLIHCWIILNMIIMRIIMMIHSDGDYDITSWWRFLWELNKWRYLSMKMIKLFNGHINGFKHSNIMSWCQGWKEFCFNLICKIIMISITAWIIWRTNRTNRSISNEFRPAHLHVCHQYCSFDHIVEGAVGSAGRKIISLQLSF